MTLDKAMVLVLNENGGKMRLEDLTQAIDRQGLYRRGDGQNLPTGQLRRRANHPSYSHLFEVGEGQIGLRCGVKAPSPAATAGAKLTVTPKTRQQAPVRTASSVLQSHAHKLPDLLAPGLRIVFCGTAAGNESSRLGFYYAGLGNRFWQVLHDVGLTPRQLHPSEFNHLLRYGIGLTDLAKNVSGMDRDLGAADFDREGLWAKIKEHRPAILALTSKHAAKELFQIESVGYGVYRNVEGTAVWVLPSTSGAARGHWDESVWRDLALDRSGPSKRHKVSWMTL